jgi:hypothetical protein
MKKIALSIILILIISQTAFMLDAFNRSGHAAEIPGMRAPSHNGLYGIHAIMRKNGPGKMKVSTLMALVRHPLVQKEIQEAQDKPRVAHEAIFDLMDRARKTYGESRQRI